MKSGLIYVFMFLNLRSIRYLVAGSPEMHLIYCNAKCQTHPVHAWKCSSFYFNSITYIIPIGYNTIQYITKTIVADFKQLSRFSIYFNGILLHNYLWFKSELAKGLDLGVDHGLLAPLDPYPGLRLRGNFSSTL